MEDENQAHTPADQQPQRNQPPPYPCQQCNRSFKTQKGFALHITRKHPEVIKELHQCHICQKVFSSAYKLKVHSDHAHSDDKAHKCTKCEFSCKSVSDLKKHFITHERNREILKCGICGKDYLWKADLNRHWKEAHVSLNNEGNTESDNSQGNNEEGSEHTPADQQRNQPRPYPCQQCSRSFTSPQGLGVHIASQHPEVTRKPHQCNTCQKLFPSSSTLKRHSENTHSEDRPYNCPRSRCKFHCKTEWVLKSHLKIHDQNGGNIKCSFCEKEYSSKFGLNYHLKTAHDSLNYAANTESDKRRESRYEEESQGEANEVIAEEAPGSILLGVRKSFENGVNAVDHPTTKPHPRLEPTLNAAPLVGWSGYSGNISMSHEDQNNLWGENQKSEGAIDEAVTAPGNACGETSQGVSFSFVSAQKEIFTSSNTTLGPSNSQREASDGIAEASPEWISIAMSHGVQNDLVTVDHHPSVVSGCTESQVQFPFGEWNCHCGNVYASPDDLEKHWEEDHNWNG